jgi:hypothetical protein
MCYLAVDAAVMIRGLVLFRGREGKFAQRRDRVSEGGAPRLGSATGIFSDRYISTDAIGKWPWPCAIGERCSGNKSHCPSTCFYDHTLGVHDVVTCKERNMRTR